MSAGRVQAIFKSMHILFPIFPLVNVGEAEFPILVRLINAFEKSLSLFILRQVQEEFDDAGAVAMQVLLQIRNGPITPATLFAAMDAPTPLPQMPTPRSTVPAATAFARGMIKSG